MVEFEMEIRGTSILTFPITPEFFPSLSPSWKRNGIEHNVVDRIPVHGWFSENDVDVLDSKIKQLHSLVQNGAPLVFIFRKMSGPEIYRLNRGHITEFSEETSPGGRVNHVEFRFTIQEERGVTFSALVDLSRRDRRTRELVDGAIRTILTRTASATGVFGNLANARSFVLAQRPSGRIIREDIDEESFDGVVTATWTVDQTREENQKDGLDVRILRWDESARVRPGLRRLSWFETQGAAIPIRGGQSRTQLVVDGRVRGFDPIELPSTNEIIGRWIGLVNAVRGPHFSDFEIGAIKPVAFDAVDPDLATEFEREYAFTLDFAEDPREPLPASAFQFLGVRSQVLATEEVGAQPPNTPGGQVGQGIPPQG